MKCLVLVKQVPDNNSVFRINSAGTWVDESSLSYALNEFDKYALEELLKLKDDGKVEEVCALTVGPADANSVLRTCLATGADRAIHIEDEALNGCDPISLARVIEAAIRDEGFSLVLAGLQAEDDNLTQIGGLLAGLQNCSFASAAKRITVGEDQTMTVERELENNQVQVVSVNLPAVVTVQTGINTPRYASLKGIMAAKKKPVKKLALSDLDLDVHQVGGSSAKMVTARLTNPPKGKGADLLEGSPDEVAQLLLTRIRENTGVL